MKPPRLMSEIPKVIQFDESFMPEFDTDVVFAYSIQMHGFLLCHETGPCEMFCWCEPELKSVDPDTGAGTFEHRTIRN